MDRSFSGKSLAILQLHKWDPNELQLDLSEFREAFLSPTRELLLLLSYQQQALIVPLITGDSIDIDVSKSCCDTSLRNSDSTALCFQELTSSSRSDLKDNIPCTSGSAMHIDNEFSLDCNFSKSNSFPFLCDVNSLAWGLCGDVYDQHKCGLFRELLFVSGNQGVMVHAFCHRDNNMAEVTTALEGGFGQGTWREWGPLSATPQNINVEKPISPSCEAPGNFIDKSGANICRGPPNKTTKRAGDDELSGTVSSKRWLQSFFTKAETIKSEGNVWTRLPNKSSFPSTAKVVSFSIFNGNIPLSYFPSQDCSLLKKESCGETIVDLENDSHKNSELSSLGVVTSHSYKCTRVFSSNSYQLIGFFLTLVDPKSVNISDNGEEKGRKNVITVARLNSFGIQWVFSVKLEERVDIGPLAEWTDFQFSDDFLVCLNSSGLISFYATDSGEYVAHLDILEASGLSHIWNCELNNSSPHADRQIEQIDEVHDRSTYKHDGFIGRRLFRRVLAASHASLLAVVDEYGVVYVISATDHVPDKYHAYEKLLPHYQHSGLGMLVGWEVGGSDVGCQRVYSNFLHSPKSDVSSKSKGNVRFFDDVGSTLLHNLQDSDLNGTGHTFHDNQMQSHLMRNVFLPTERFGQYDSVCFSPLGITWLIRRQNLKAQKSSQLVHLNLRTDSTIWDDRYLNSRIGMFPLQGKKEASMEQAVGCIFQGRFYLVTESGLSVILPSVSVSSHFVPVETIGYRQPSINISTERGKSSFELEEPKRPWSPWKLEILDRVLLYEGPEDADRLCLENGWDLKISRVRRLQMALNCLKFEEVKQSLEMLGGVNLAEEGILRLLLAAGYLMSNKNGNESEISAASRLLTLATWFTTKMIREYGFLQHKIDSIMEQGLDRTRGLPLPPALPDKLQNEIGNSIRLHDLAHFLEIIRKLQCQLSPKVKKSAQGLVDQGEALSAMDPRSLQDEFQLSTPLLDSFESSNHHEPLFSDEKFALVPKNSLSSETNMNSEDSSEASAIVPQGMVFGKKVLPLENPKEMIARWKIDKLDLKTVVKDALLSGRLPLAVLQLHLHRSREFVSDVESYDTFTEVSGIGKAIAYDLFLKGESGLAIATLQKLGEDLEICLRELLFGTVRRPLRAQIVEEMSRYGYLGPYEHKILERISLIERLYPSSSFLKTFLSCRKERMHVTSSLSSSGGGINLHLLDSHLFHDLVIHCGDIDGVVLGSWTNVNENLSDPVLDQDGASAGYWAAAAVWSNAWDQRIIDRIVLDQPYLMGVHVSWESQLEYHICHNNWEEVFKLLDVIPESVLSDGSLKIALDGSQPSSTVEYSSEFPDYAKYICSIEELDAASLDVPDIKIFRFSSYSSVCCAWLRMCIERELVKKFIFLKEYWEGTLEMVSLLACSGFITGKYKILMEDDSRPSDLNFSVSGERLHADTMQAFDKLLVHHCARYYLPNLLDLYLDRHKLVLDDDSLFSLLEAAGDCHWARWLLLSRMKGHEYDASFANACSILSHNVTHDSNLHVLEADEIICTIDDIAERGGEMAALATLMYAPSPIQNCISSGSVNRHGSSAQCTLENLKPALQHFPTLWRTLESVCFGEETASGFMGPKANNALSAYLNWRDNIFFSAAHDTSLLQMLPCWFPKAVRRLIQLYVQGPLRWESLLGLPTVESLFRRDTEFYINADESEISAVSWEATIEKHVTEELYDSSIVETGLGLEHHLHRGCALAALNHLLLSRVEKLKLEGRSSSSAHGQKNVQSDVQTLLASLTQSERSMLSPVMPLAITHFEDSMLVASCTFCMELCGLSASMLRVDVAALRRISSFYKSSEINENFRQLSPKGSAFHAVCDEGSIMLSLACALADEYLHQDTASNSKVKGYPHSVANKQPSPAPMLVLQHLEKASIPMLVNGKTCGSWLLTGNGDGTELRSQQKAASQLWSLVTIFCQMHQLPLSTKYLAVLARDNDWVGFLSEAQIGGYPFDIVVQVASKEFSDPRLKTHILTVLKNMQSRRISGSSCHIDTTEKGNESTFKEENIYVPVELFGILADCEKKENPGDALLIKAKELSWSILAMIASCFPDVSPLSCLTVWLEITAARETSSIKVNDIASQIADNVAAAVEATNSMPAGSRAVAFHYNRRNPKRKRLMEPIAANPWSGASDGSVAIFSGESVQAGEETNVKLGEEINISVGSIEGSTSLSKMVAVLCEQRLFLPLLKAFEMFLPSCSLLTFIRALQAFSQMRLPEASAHLGSFTARIKEEPGHLQTNVGSGHIGTSWISSTAIEAADAMLSTCPSPYEKRCLLQLLAGTDFGDGGSAATGYRRLYWKINLAEPSLRKSDNLDLGNETLDDASLLTALEKNRQWDQARNWTRQLEASGGPWKSTIHNVTEMQAESMVAEWKEFLWDVPEERIALWGHCQTLFIRYSFPALRAGLFFLKHAEAAEKDLPARELHELLLLSLQWLSGMITQSNPVYPLHLLREIETRVWLLAVESEAQINSEGDLSIISSRRDTIIENTFSIIDGTANLITKMDNHINAMKNRTNEKYDARENNQAHYRNQLFDSSSSTMTTGGIKTKRRAKGYVQSRRPLTDTVDKGTDSEDSFYSYNSSYFKNDLRLQDESFKIEVSFSKWEERIDPAELERAVLSLLEFGQIAAAKQLQQKLSPGKRPFEFKLVDTALKLAAISTPNSEVPVSMLDEELFSIIQSCNLLTDQHTFYPLQVLESLATIFAESSGRGLCKRIISVVKAANTLGLSFLEAFDKQPVELLRLLSLKAQESFEEAKLLVQTHLMPATSIAQILAESFLKGLLAAHRGGYMDSQKEEGPAPLLWRFSDFLKWAELCPSEPEIGHALMRLVITGQEIPHACEVELLILSHHFYKLSACLDGVDVLVALAATRVEAYVSEGDFPCLARLITGVGNFHTLNFILGILIENGQLDLLLQKYSTAADTKTYTTDADRGFRMAVLTSLKHFNASDLNAFAMIYNHFDMKHETAALLESQARQSCQQWFQRHDRYLNEDLLDAMRYFIEAAEVHSSIDAGNKTRQACAQASLVSLQIRMPDYKWLNLSETNARRALVEQSRFQEALIVAEAYGLNQPSEWALVLWNQMPNPELTEEFVDEFVAVLPLQQSMLAELAKFYKAEVTARGDQSQFSVWLTGGGLPADWAKHLGRSFRCLLKRTRDLRFRMHLATTATGFGDIVNACIKALDKYPDNAGPLVLRKGHGGTYLPVM